jgi:hypothetical protein
MSKVTSEEQQAGQQETKLKMCKQMDAPRNFERGMDLPDRYLI